MVDGEGEGEGSAGAVGAEGEGAEAEGGGVGRVRGARDLEAWERRRNVGLKDDIVGLGWLLGQMANRGQAGPAECG